MRPNQINLIIMVLSSTKLVIGTARIYSSSCFCFLFKAHARNILAPDLLFFPRNTRIFESGLGFRNNHTDVAYRHAPCLAACRIIPRIVTL